MDKIEKSYECCIIGAGPAGLGAALELIKGGVSSIAIIDKNLSAGGLSRTDIFSGARFDIGPHCFFSHDEEINKIWKSILGNDLQPHQRLTRFYYNNKYFVYPVKPLDVLKNLGLAESLNIVNSFLFSRLTGGGKAVTCEDWIISKFGRRLYDVFFKSYIEKVWGVSCKEIGAEWAEQRIKGVSVPEVLRHAFFGKRKQNKSFFGRFEYPLQGAGQVYRVMADRAVACGADLMLNCKVIKYNRQGNTITSVEAVDAQGRLINIEAKQFFSSIPLKHFFKMLNPLDTGKINEAADKLRYRAHITVNLLVSRNPVFLDQWITCILRKSRSSN